MSRMEEKMASLGTAVDVKTINAAAESAARTKVGERRVDVSEAAKFPKVSSS